VLPFNGDSNFELVGLGDLNSPFDFKLDKSFETCSTSKSTVTRIVLSHHPDSALQFVNFQVHLQLSGHTHGGQICVPFTRTPLLKYIKIAHNFCPKFLRRLFPKQIHVVKDWKWGSGLHKVTNNTGGTNVLYVSRGLATHPPFRFLCPPEVTVFQLNCQ